MKLRATLLLFFVLSLGSAPAGAAEPAVAKTRTDVSLKNEVDNAIGRGLTWLAANQKPQGFWSQEEHPALTALVLTAFQGDPSGFYRKKFGTQVARGYDYLLRNVKPDGGIYGKDLTNYNTSVSMMALLLANDRKYDPAIRKARNFLVGLQDDFGEKGMGDSPYDGGIGYGGSHKHSDLSNTHMALEAIHYAKYVRSDIASDADVKELNWKAAIQFVSRCQNLPGHNDQAWATGDADNRGGFIYFPGDSKAGEQKLESGEKSLRSYGSMSYAGLLSYIYAEMDKSDPRVKAVFDWLTRHYTVEENPGMGKEGLFYYYHTMAKALSKYGVKTLKLKDGTAVDWRADLAKKLLDLQRGDGSWINESGRWWERDPVLVSSYAVITLEIVRKGL